VPVYATQAEYEASPYGATPAPADITKRLAVASADIDGMILTAVYDVDSSDLPTDTAIREALRQATIAQAKHTIDRAAATTRTATEVSIGTARVKYGTASGEVVVPEGPLSSEARTILHNAGLTPATVYRPGG
jgi:hypothetical protein